MSRPGPTIPGIGGDSSPTFFYHRRQPTPSITTELTNPTQPCRPSPDHPTTIQLGTRTTKPTKNPLNFSIYEDITAEPVRAASGSEPKQVSVSNTYLLAIRSADLTIFSHPWDEREWLRDFATENRPEMHPVTRRRRRQTYGMWVSYGPGRVWVEGLDEEYLRRLGEELS